MDRYLDLGGFFDEFDDRIDLVVTMKDGVSSFFYDIKPGINWYDQWFTFEYVGRYAKSVYFRSDDVSYFTIVPVENGNRAKNQREQCEVEKSWEDANYAF
jgi:hypothetical protein